MSDPLPLARAALTRFLGDVPRDGRVVVLCHSDADGLAAGALFGRALPRAGYTDVRVVPTLRGESAFSDEARARIAPLEPDALIVTDLGVHAAGVLPGVPTLYVDHHQPAGEPDGVVVSGYAWEPVPSSAWLARDLLAAIADVDDLDWIAAVGTISDLGERAPWPRLAGIRKRFTAKWLKEAVVLVNAARRHPAYDLDTPLRMLMTLDHPRGVSEAVELGAERLHRYRAEVNAELREARRHPPVFSRTRPFALITLHSAAQVHPLIAQQWRGRLPKYAAMAANTGYLEGEVAFSCRTARGDLDLPAIFQSIDLGDHDGRFGYGHDQASGGHLPPDAFNELLRRLDFPNEALLPG